MRITKNDTAHAIRLKLSEIWCFIVPPWFSLSRAAMDGAVRKTLQSVKICKLAESSFWADLQRYHE